MRVCFVTTAFPRWLGDGQAAFVWEAVRAIARQGIDVRVIAMHSPGLPIRERMEGIEIVRPRYWWPESWEMLRREGAAGLPATWQKYPQARLQILPFFLVHTVAAARYARSCDVVHAEWTLSGAAALASRWLHQRPVMVTLQGSDIFQVTRHRLGAWLTRSVLRRCDRISALSNALRDSTAASGVPADRVQIIPNGVDTRSFVPPQEDSRESIILYVGTFIKRKGLTYLLEAFRDVLAAHPKYRLVLIGEGPQSPDLRRHAESLGVAEHVSFIEFLPQEQVKEWMQRAKVFVLPSLEEGMGVVLLEAMACGTPLVASRVDGIKDVVVPDVGILVPPADVRSLSEAICSLLGERDEWERMSQSARELAVSRYDWDKIARQYVELYRSMV
ncbi:glycosyltransferase [Chloroflexota bacterium]